ncbi:hypothetical protein BH24BAC1_BH24BAC1_04020 [soil metagenome]
MSSSKDTSRRLFLKKLGGTTALMASGSLVLGAASPEQEHQLLEPVKRVTANDKIRIACIGTGIMGFNNLSTALKVDGVELVGVCDLYDGRLTRAKELYGSHLFTTRDYREILARPDVDAVIVATTDHWHDHISVDAMQKGKAVYCEKPMVHHIEEGQRVIDTQKKTGKVFQVGSQRQSSIVYEQAKKLYEAGEIGQLNMVEATMDRFSALGAWQYSIPPDASPQTIAWDRYLGDAPKVPFDPVRFFRWRNYRDYGTGVAGDLFVHLLTGVHFITSSLGPKRIMSSGGLTLWKDGRDVPDLIMSVLDYPQTAQHPAFQLMMRANFADGSGGGSFIRMVGTEGEIRIGGNDVTVKRQKLAAAPGYGGWDSFSTFAEATQKEFVQQYEAQYPAARPEMMAPKEMTYTAPRGYSEHLDHWTNFFTSLRTGKPVIQDASFGLRAAAPSLAANKSYFEQKMVHWDPVKMKLAKAPKT